MGLPVEAKSVPGSVLVTRSRRSRGYVFERSVVDRLNALRGWKAYRLGGASTYLPDVLAMNTFDPRALILELKSGRNKSRLYVMLDQISRLYDWRMALSPFRVRTCVLGFRFHMSLTDIREYWHRMPLTEPGSESFCCTSDGELLVRRTKNGEYRKVRRETQMQMPWEVESS